MLSDIIRKDGNDICNDGSYKKRFQGVDDVCYLSISMDRITRDFAAGKCQYMKGFYDKKVGNHYIFYCKCDYKKVK